MIQPSRRPGVFSPGARFETKICKNCAQIFFAKAAHFCSDECRAQSIQLRRGISASSIGRIKKYHCMTIVLPPAVSSDGLLVQRIAIAYERACRIIKIYDSKCDDPEMGDKSVIEFEHICRDWQEARKWLRGIKKEELHD